MWPGSRTWAGGEGLSRLKADVPEGMIPEGDQSPTRLTGIPFLLRLRSIHWNPWFLKKKKKNRYPLKHANLPCLTNSMRLSYDDGRPKIAGD